MPTAFGNDTYKIIDVRTPEEIAGGMIDDAIHIDFVSVDFEEKLNALDKGSNYVVYCRSGGRSGKTIEKNLSIGPAPSNAPASKRESPNCSNAFCSG